MQYQLLLILDYLYSAQSILDTSSLTQITKVEDHVASHNYFRFLYISINLTDLHGPISYSVLGGKVP